MLITGAAVSLSRRQELFFTAFTSEGGRKAALVRPFRGVRQRRWGVPVSHYSLLSLNFEFVGSKRSSPSLLARQLCLRLVDSDIPRNLSNIVVSIHVIATFQALHDYLRPRISGLLSSRLKALWHARSPWCVRPGASFGPVRVSGAVAECRCSTVMVCEPCWSKQTAQSSPQCQEGEGVDFR